MEALVRFAVIHEDIIAEVEPDKPGRIAVGVSGKFVSVSRSAFVRRRNDSDVLTRVVSVPIQTEKTELRIVVVPSEIIADSIAVIVLVDVRGSPTGGTARRKPNNAVIGTGKSGFLRGKIRIDRIQGPDSGYSREQKHRKTEKGFARTRNQVFHR